jgi:hypothetical protein
MTMVGKAPPWVGGLIAEPRGRSLVLALSAAHRNCTLLNYAITRILEKVGRSGMTWSMTCTLMCGRAGDMLGILCQWYG